jgi:uncharacterized protein (DUF1499 family)
MAPQTPILLLVVSMSLLGCSPRHAPGELTAGHLRPCPNRPNCVSSEDGCKTQVQPLSYTTDPNTAVRLLLSSLEDAGGTIERTGPECIWATFRSSVFRFVDDVELRHLASEQLFHIRSGSRLGYSDLGVNGKRVEKIRALFLEKLENLQLDDTHKGKKTQ